MFSLNHIVLLLVCAAAVTVGTVASVKGGLSSKKASAGFLVLCLVSETVKDLSNIVPSDFGGFVLDPLDIPLHLCSVVVFAMLYIVLTKNDEGREHIKTAVVVIGLIAPALALLIPTEGVDFGKPITYQYFGYHAALLWYALHHVFAKQVTFGRDAYIRNLKYCGLATAFFLYLNSALSAYGANYCFFREPPMKGLPILNLDHGWHVYFVTLLLIGFAAVTAVHLPSLIRERRRK